MREARATRYCAAGFELIPTAMRSPTCKSRPGVRGLAVHVRFQAAIHHLRHMAQCDFAQRDQIAGAKEVSQRAVRTFRRIDIAPPHARLQRLRGHIRQHNFVHPLQHPVGNRLAHHHAGDLVHHGRNALQVLHVHGRNHIDVGCRAIRKRLRSACDACCLQCWCAPVRRPARLVDAVRGWRQHPSPRKCVPL